MSDLNRDSAEENSSPTYLMTYKPKHSALAFLQVCHTYLELRICSEI